MISGIEYVISRVHTVAGKEYVVCAVAGMEYAMINYVHHY